MKQGSPWPVALLALWEEKFCRRVDVVCASAAPPRSPLLQVQGELGRAQAPSRALLVSHGLTTSGPGIPTRAPPQRPLAPEVTPYQKCAPQAPGQREAGPPPGEVRRQVLSEARDPHPRQAGASPQEAGQLPTGQPGPRGPPGPLLQSPRKGTRNAPVHACRRPLEKPPWTPTCHLLARCYGAEVATLPSHRGRGCRTKGQHGQCCAMPPSKLATLDLNHRQGG